MHVRGTVFRLRRDERAKLCDCVLANGSSTRIRTSTSPVGNRVSTATERALREKGTKFGSIGSYALITLVPVFVPKETLMIVNRGRSAREVPDKHSKRI